MTVGTVLGGHSKRLHTERSTQPERRLLMYDRGGRGPQRSGAQRFTWPAHARFRRHRASFTCGPVDDTPTFECHPHAFTCGHAVDDTVLYRLRADPASVRCHVCKWAAPARRTAVSRAQSASHHRTLHAGATEHSMLVLVRWPSSSLSRPRPLPPHARLRYVAHPAGEPYI